MTKVAVLGAGINGVSCAVKIKEKYPNVEVVLISWEFSPHTTGDGSGGFWYPYLCGNTPQEILTKWGCETYQYLMELWREGGHDICLLPMYGLRGEPIDYDYDWTRRVLGYGQLNQKQIDYFNELYSAKYVAGITFTTFMVYPPIMLAYLYQRFNAANGQILQRKISSLSDEILEDYDVVINCLGFGAKEVVPDDKMVPIRGQISRVLAPWVLNAVIDDSGKYILPNAHNCVLGGTSERNVLHTNIVDKDTEYVLNSCTQLMPGLQHAQLVTHWAGLRPGREAVRLESEERDGKLFIHNYGHGGSGFTLFWGCASNVLEIFDKHMNKHKEKSKL